MSPDDGPLSEAVEIAVDKAASTIVMMSTPWQRCWLSILARLGCLTAFTHQVLINPAMSLVIQPLCQLPLALCSDITDELQKLLEAGNPEQIDASLWISNLVVVKKKKFGGLRPCDLRQVNKVINYFKYTVRILHTDL